MPLIPINEPPVLWGAGTHPGETGKNNEDSYTLRFFLTADRQPVTLAFVADGIGGNRSGEVASALAVKTLSAALQHATLADPLADLTAAFAETAQVLAGASQQDGNNRGMGTTGAAALLVGRRLYVGYIGDSRIYLRRRDHTRQISIDHTWIQAAIEHGIISREEAKTHPNQHVVVRHLGGKAEVRPDLRLKLRDDEFPDESEQNQGLELHTGDEVLVCSDGLSDLVDTLEINHLLGKYPPQQAVDELILLARKRGGHDNITVVVIQAP